MDTKKLYYEDSHLRSFAARVLSCAPAEGGFAVILDATAFYPEGGGQACDTGTLDGVSVLDVQEKDGQVVHLCSGPLPAGQQVGGVIDWDRRFDLMQQHTGEHILSGYIYKKYGYHNVGFHIGADTVTADFDGPVPESDLWEIQAEINRVVWENVPLKCWVPAPEELPQVFYRTKKPLPWPVRIVEIPGADSCACCGIQVKRTGEVGLIQLLSCVKFHQGVRIEMLSGSRALSYLNAIYRQNKQVSAAFSAKPLETGAAARQMNALLAEEKFRATGLEKQLFASLAAPYAGMGNVLLFHDNLQPGSVREFAVVLSQSCNGVAGVLSGSDKDGYTLCLVGEKEAVSRLSGEVCSQLSGKGGGKPGFFQGRLSAPQTGISEFFAKEFAVYFV